MMGRKIQDGFLSCLHFSWSAGVAEHIKRVAGQGAILPLLIQIFASCILPSNTLRMASPSGILQMLPVCGQGMAMPLNEKKTRTRKQTNKKTHGKLLQLGLFWEKMLQRWKREAYFQQGKKPSKFHFPPQRASFLELDWFLTSGLLCGCFRDTILCPWGLMTSSVSSLDFCRAGHDGLTWSCVRNVEL